MNERIVFTARGRGLIELVLVLVLVLVRSNFHLVAHQTSHHLSITNRRHFK